MTKKQLHEEMKQKIAKLRRKYKVKLAEETLSAKLETEKKMLMPGVLGKFQKIVLDVWHYYTHHKK